MQAEEIAEKLCESVAASLEGKKLGSFTRISSTVQVFSTSSHRNILSFMPSIHSILQVGNSVHLMVTPADSYGGGSCSHFDPKAVY